MGAALPQGGALDDCSTPVTRLTIPLVDLKMVLKITPTVNPIDAGAVSFDPLEKHLPDGCQQNRGLLLIQRACPGLRVDSGREQAFIGVDITQTGNEGLIQQQRFDRAFVLVQAGIKFFGRQSLVQRLGAKTAGDLTRIVHQPHPSELAGVVEGHTVAVIQVKNHAVVFRVAGGLCRFKQDVSAHAQVDQEMLSRKGEVEKFAASADGSDLLSCDQGCKITLRWRGYAPRPKNAGVEDGPSHHAGFLFLCVSKILGGPQ